MVSVLAQRLFFALLKLYRGAASWFLRVTAPWSHLTAADEDVVTGKAWEEFCDSLSKPSVVPMLIKCVSCVNTRAHAEAAGAVLLAPGAPRDPFNQAEGYRYLTRILRGGLENFVECMDVEAPKLCAIADGWRAAPVKLGSDNPDNLYESASIDGTKCYIVSGTRGTVSYLGLGTQKGQYGSDGGLKTVSYMESSEIIYDDMAKKTFRVILSADRPRTGANVPPNWMKLCSDISTALFIVRQTFGLREKEVPARLQISMWDPITETTITAMPAPLTTEKLQKGLRSTALFVAGASAMFASWSKGFQKHTNKLPMFDQKLSDSVGGDPNIRYYHSYWNIPPDHALVIKFNPPDCKFWNFQLNNHWMESLDYRYHPVHVNSAMARGNVDGTCTIIVAHNNPNVVESPTFYGNWVSTAGHECGTMCLRWVYSADAAPPNELLDSPQTELVLFDSIFHSGVLVN